MVSEPPNAPDGPEPGAVKVTTRPAMPAPPDVLTLADSNVPNVVVIVVDWPEPMFTSIANGLRLVIVVKDVVIEPNVTVIA